MPVARNPSAITDRFIHNFVLQKGDPLLCVIETARECIGNEHCLFLIVIACAADKILIIAEFVAGSVGHSSLI